MKYLLLSLILLYPAGSRHVYMYCALSPDHTKWTAPATVTTTRSGNGSIDEHYEIDLTGCFYD